MIPSFSQIPSGLNTHAEIEECPKTSYNSTASQTHELWHGKANQNTAIEQLQSHTIAQALVAETASKAATEVEKQRLVDGVTALSQDLVRELFKESNKSLCVAPISLMPILGMIVKGLAGDAKSAMLKAINCENMAEEHFHKVLNAVREDYAPGIDPETTIQIENGLAHGASDTAQDFIDTVRNVYKGEVFQVKDSDPSVIINRWFADKTQGKIAHIVPSNINLEMGVAMLNAVVFAAVWKDPFDKSSTFSYRFICLDGRKVQAMIMKKKAYYKVYNAADFSMLELPYKSQGDHLSQLIFLPKKAHQLESVLKMMTPEFIAQCRSQAKEQETHLFLPRLEVQYSQNLLSVMSKIGLPVTAPLSNISKRDRLGLIQHQIKLSSDEEGTRGVAATAALTYRCADNTPVFSATKPFSYMIVDNRSGGNMIQFQGTVTDDSVLVSEEKAKELNEVRETRLIDSVDTTMLDEAAATAFVKENSDLQPLFKHLPEDLKAVKVLQQEIEGTHFDIVNYTNYDLRFDTNFYLRINRQQIDNLYFTKDSCQLVLFEHEDHLILKNKDIGSDHVQVMYIHKSLYTKGKYSYAHLRKNMNTKILDEAATIAFVEENSDLQPLFKHLPVDLKAVKVLQQEIGKAYVERTYFDIVNYTKYELRFDPHFYLRINRQQIGEKGTELRFTKDNCQLVLFEHEDHLILKNKDIGSDHVSTLYITESAFTKGKYSYSYHID